MDRLVSAITRFVQHGPGTAYAVVGGRHQPVDDPRPTADAAARGAGCGPLPAR